MVSRISTSPEYKAYYRANGRCNNPNSTQYKYYGGRGIRFRFQSFIQFLDHLGKRPTVRHSLDRINNDGHYELGNVRWATKKEQRANRRRRLDASGVDFLRKPRRKPWRARIVIHDKRVDIGYFETKEEAHQAYLDAVKHEVHN